MHHDRSGAVVRVAILAVLLGGGFLGWQYFSSHRQSAGLVTEEQQMADAGATAAPETYPTPPAETIAPEPAPAAAPAAAPSASPRRTASPRREAAPEPVPPPSTTIEPSVAPVPAPVSPMPPDATTGD